MAKSKIKKKEREKGKFLKVRCEKCKKNQIIYNKASTKVECLSCGFILTSPKGGKAKIHGKIMEILNKEKFM